MCFCYFYIHEKNTFLHCQAMDTVKCLWLWYEMRLSAQTMVLGYMYWVICVLRLLVPKEVEIGLYNYYITY